MADEINTMFSKIYQKYDFMNHLFSFNLDKSWRDEAAKEAIITKERYVVLDVASGTGDLAIAISKIAKESDKKVRVLAYDFNKDMLAVAKEKLGRECINDIEIELGNAFDIKHKASSFDVLTSGFGLRSFVFSKGGKRNLEKFLAESYRVLKPNGKIVLLDMAMPDEASQKAFFKAYSVFMLAVGSLVDRETYSWLVRTIKAFDKKELIGAMNSSGFRNTKIRSLRSGIAFIATGEK